MSIESEITRINNNIAATYTALSAKGATMPATENSANLASTVATVPSGGGVDPVNKVFEVNEGVLNKPTAAFSDNTFAGVTSIANDGLYYAYYKRTNITGSISFPQLTTVGDYGLFHAFNGCTGLTGSVSFPSLTSIGDSGLYYAFSGCTGLTGSISFPKLTTVNSSGLQCVFQGCTGLNSVSFTELTTIDTSALSLAFNRCTNLMEIHFPAAIQATIEALLGYNDKFGATNANIYFDL